MSAEPTFIAKALFRARQKPFLIWVAPPFLIVLGLQLLALVALSTVEDATASMRLGGVTLVLSEFPYVHLPGAVALMVVWFEGAFGLVYERPWARGLLTWGALVAYAAVGAGAAGTINWPDRVVLVSLAQGLIPWAVIFWYFYWYPPVVRYYDRLGAPQVS